MLTGIVCGVDMVSIARIEKALSRSGERFLHRIFAESELGLGDDIGFLATRFAAKEAFFKALGTGLAGGVRWHDFALPPRRDTESQGHGLLPLVSGRAADYLEGRKVLVSVSRTAELAVAVVFLEGSGGRS